MHLAADSRNEQMLFDGLQLCFLQLILRFANVCLNLIEQLLDTGELDLWPEQSTKCNLQFLSVEGLFELVQYVCF